MAYDGIYAREFTHAQQLPTESDNEPKISIRALSKKCQPFIHGVRIHINSPVEGDQSVGNAANMSALGCDFNRSMQHLNSHYRERGVAYEVPNEKILHSIR